MEPNIMKPLRLKRLPENIRAEIRNTRKAKGWSQQQLGLKTGIAQTRISSIETGDTVPRYDTLIEILRVLEHDLVLVPRQLLPAVKALVRDYNNRDEYRPDIEYEPENWVGALLHAAEEDED